MSLSLGRCVLRGSLSALLLFALLVWLTSIMSTRTLTELLLKITHGTPHVCGVRREARASLARSVAGGVVEAIAALRPSGSHMQEDVPSQAEEAMGLVDTDGSSAQVGG